MRREPVRAESRRREPLRPAHVEWVRPGLHTAAIATAATAGVLVRFGVASGMGALGTFTETGRLLAGVARADGAWAHGVATVAGLFVHLLVVSTWSLVYARVVAGWEGRRRWIAAAGVSALTWATGRFLLPEMLRLDHGARALPPQILLLHVVLFLSLAVGMRLAFAEGDEQ